MSVGVRQNPGTVVETKDMFHNEYLCCYLCLQDIDPSVFESWILPQCLCHGTTSTVHPDCFLGYMRHKRFQTRCSICMGKFYFPHAMATSPHTAIRSIYMEYLRHSPFTFWRLVTLDRQACLWVVRMQMFMILRWSIGVFRQFFRIYIFLFDIWLIVMCISQIIQLYRVSSHSPRVSLWPS